MTDRRPPSPLAFAAWAVAGAGLLLSVASILTIGGFLLFGVLPVLAALALLPATRNVSATGLVSGAGLVPLFVGWLNRGGPGNVCRSLPGNGSECSQELTPWPFWGIGALMLAAGVVLFVVLRRRPPRAPMQVTWQVPPSLS